MGTKCSLNRTIMCFHGCACASFLSNSIYMTQMFSSTESDRYCSKLCAHQPHLYMLQGFVLKIQVMKDMYLLGRGELYLSFVDVADALLKQPPTTTTQHG